MSRASVFTRPELTKADLKAFQVAKYVAMNPSRSDVLTALHVAEKSSQNNHLSPEDALAAFDKFTENNLHSTFCGEYECPRHLKYPIQGTVLQLVRLTEELTGLICDRQFIAPGLRSKAPLHVGPNGLLSGKKPTMSLSRSLTYFWPYLSDEDLDELHSRCAIYVMSTLVPAQKAEEVRHKENLKQRRESLESLFRGVRPKFTTEFSQQCKNIANSLEQEEVDAITWRDLKQAYPGVTSRYQANFLALTDNNQITARQLKNATHQTEFNLRLTSWEGAMRLFDVPQLVLQVRNIPLHFRFSQKSVFHQELSSEIKSQARAVDHPATENTIGWLRIHVDDENKLCFVDEVQSDAMELALEYSRNIRYTNAAKEFMKECSSWSLHAFATVYQWSENVGYRAAIHSKESAATVEFMTDSERKWRTYYAPVIKKYSLKKELVSKYAAEIFVAQKV